MRIFSRLNIGGPSIQVVLLTAKLDPAIYDTSLVIGREEDREGNFLSLAESMGVEPVSIPTLGRSIRPLGDLRSFIELCRLMRRQRPHIVHTHTAKAGALGRLAALLTGVPIVVHTFHGSVFSGYFGKISSRVYASVERVLARVTDTIIAVSPAVLEEISGHGLRPRTSAVAIRLGLPLERFYERPHHGTLRARLGLSRETPLVGCVGRLVPIKDLPTLLSAIAGLGGVHLAVIGDGPERKALEARAHELGIGARVHFTGFLSELEKIYPDLDVVVNSSRNEGTPVALIEAMAAEVPVVATAVGGSIDLLERGGLGELVPPANAEALAAGIAAALEQTSALAARTRKARSIVTETYQAERLVDDIDALYRTLLIEKGVSEGGVPVAACQT